MYSVLIQAGEHVSTDSERDTVLKASDQKLCFSPVITSVFKPGSRMQTGSFDMEQSSFMPLQSQINMSKRVILKGANGTHKIFQIGESGQLSIKNPGLSQTGIRVNGQHVLMDKSKYCDFFQRQIQKHRHLNVVEKPHGFMHNNDFDDFSLLRPSLDRHNQSLDSQGSMGESQGTKNQSIISPFLPLQKVPLAKTQILSKTQYKLSAPSPPSEIQSPLSSQ
jgi:hypothetical protein